MNVELPAGCNIINSATSFYNYSNNNYTRKQYYIYEGKAILNNTTTSTRPYEYTGDCLVTGDLVYKPETEVYFQFIAIISVISILFFIWRILFRRLIK